MKKLLLCLLLCGCNFVPELIRNPACEETRDVNYTVFQPFSDSLDSLFLLTNYYILLT